MLPLVGHVLVHQVAVVLNHVLKKEESERTVESSHDHHHHQEIFLFLLGSTDWRRGRPAYPGCLGVGREAGPADTKDQQKL